MKDSILKDKAKAFGLRIIALCEYLGEKQEQAKGRVPHYAAKALVTNVMIKQIVRSGTSIAANISEGYYGQSADDFISKMSIALKEASETETWLEFLHDSGRLTDSEFTSIHDDCVELLKLLTSTIKTSKSRFLPKPRP